MHEIAVYGSLKRGCYNHYLLERTGAVFKGEGLAKGYGLYSLGMYPAAVPRDEADLLKVEFYEVDDRTFEVLNSMERGAGYYAVSLPEGQTMWVMPESYGHPLVEPKGGVFNWSQRIL